MLVTEEAFNHLAGRHRRELLIHCYRMLGSVDDAEDAVQDALLRAWRYRESLIEGAPLRPWLYRVATNVCLDARSVSLEDLLISDDPLSDRIEFFGRRALRI